MKKNPVEFKHGLKEINELVPVSFMWDSGEDITTHYGLQVQTKEPVIPGVIVEGVPETIGFAYTELIPILIKAIQELSSEVDKMKVK